MPKTLKSYFLFLVPTLIVAVVFIAIIQQNIAATDDSIYDVAVNKIEVPNKHSGAHVIPVIFFFFNGRSNEPLFAEKSGVPDFIFLQNYAGKLSIEKNRSPPQIFAA